MIIFLDESLVESLNDSKNINSVLNALAICSQQAREGVHIILSSRMVFEGLVTHYPKMDSRTVATLRRSSEKLTGRKQIRDFVTHAIRLVSDETISVPTRRIFNNRVELLLPVAAVDNSSSLVGKILLMVENINDGHAYLKLARSVAKDNIFPGLGWLGGVPLRCEIVPGGGNTLAGVFDYHNTLGERIGIAIADGDYRYAGGGMGDTAKALLRVASAVPSPLLETMILTVRTIENCLPRAEISRIAAELDAVQHRSFEQVKTLFEKSEFWGFIPIKSGVRCFELEQKSAESKFWTEVLGGRQCVPGSACHRKQDCRSYILPSISDKILANSVSGEGSYIVTDNCLSGVTEVWRMLLFTIFSLFCGADKASMI